MKRWETMMEQERDRAEIQEATSRPFDVLIDEFVADIRRRVKAVERLIEPRRHSWSFDPDALPRDDAEKLVIIKREVENIFNSVFSSRRRSRGPNVCGSRHAASMPTSARPRGGSRPAA
jgi:hypothetical protein